MTEQEKNEYCLQVATEIQKQLFWSIDKWTYISWGVSGKGYMYYNGIPSLAMRVSGALFKGQVIISLNEGLDTYEVRLVKRGGKVAKVVEDVYCDMLGSLIDSLVERPETASDEEYTKLIQRDEAKKVRRVS